MPEAITIKSDPAPAMAPDQEQAPEGDIQVQGEEPLLAGKYKTVDDLVKGYKELESERNRPEPEPEAVAEEAEPAEQSDDAPDANSIYGEYIGSRLTEAGIDFQNMNSRWQETGQLSDDDYNELGNAGFGRDMVDAYLSGLQFQQSQDSALAAQQVMQANIAAAQGGPTPEQAMVQMEAQRLQIEQEKVQAQLAKEASEGALKNRDLDLKEQKLALDAYKIGAEGTLKADEKEKDRNAKAAIKAVELLADMVKHEDNLESSEAAKAIDVISRMIADSKNK